MARKSNKTAHVLNLIAGHEAPADSTEETISMGEASASPSKKTTPAAAAPAQTISVIDTTEEDPVADLIQQNLTSKFEGENAQAPAEASVAPPAPDRQTAGETPATEQPPIAEEPATPQNVKAAEAVPVQTPNTEEVATTPAQTPNTEIVTSAPAQEGNTEVVTSAPVQEKDTETAEAAPAEDAKEAETAKEAEETEEIKETTAETEAVQAEPEPEPDFVRVNVIEEVVKDKIIYFMRQFDVCTCERCIQDTIALTLNGILPKYIVTTPAAVAPLMSFYTNRYITDVTVEATKACMIVKENPRH